MPRLTDRFMTTLAVVPGQRDRLVFDTVCPGLGVRVTAKGTRTFLAQWTDPATKRKVREPLGVWGSITVDQAREATRAKLGRVAIGINPRAERAKIREADERSRAEAALTFDALVEQWGALHLTSCRPSYAAGAKRAIRADLAGLMKRPASQITKADAVNALDRLIKAGKRTTAARTLSYARAAFQWALKRGKVPGNPFQGLPIPVANNARERVLCDTELAEIWQATGAMGYPWGHFYRVALLTLQRREEVAGMRWSELSGDLSLWTIPGARMKRGKAHDVHLPETIRAILRTVPRVEGSDLVFTTTASLAHPGVPISGFSRAKLALDKAIIRRRREAADESDGKPEPLLPWVLHDFRRTGVSTLARLGFDSIVCDKLLAHQPAKLGGVAGVYQRHDFATERQRALEAWAAHVTGLGNGGNVLRFDAAKSRMAGSGGA